MSLPFTEHFDACLPQVPGAVLNRSAGQLSLQFAVPSPSESRRVGSVPVRTTRCIGNMKVCSSGRNSSGRANLAPLSFSTYQAATERPRSAAKARKHEADAGYLSLMNLKMNYLADPLMATPRFAEVLARIRGD